MSECGATIGQTEVTGVGQRFDATRTATRDVRSVPLDSVVGFESYERQVNPGRTLLYGVPTLAASTIGVAVTCPDPVSSRRRRAPAG